MRDRQPIAVDAMGGDGAPQVAVRGALEAVTELENTGPPCRSAQGGCGASSGVLASCPPLELVDAPDVIRMQDPPISVLRGKNRSSLNVCAELVRDGRAAAMVTAGNTGAAWVAAKSALGMIDGVDRPALAAVVPKDEGRTLVLDVGANMECKAHQLVQFAVMGSLYAEAIFGVSTPRVGLMSVGEEESKGGPRVRERNRGLAAAGINFIGNVEGDDVFDPEVDVIVCDGFTGNVILKVAKGSARWWSAC